MPTSVMCTPTTPLVADKVRPAACDDESSVPDAIQRVVREVTDAARTIFGADTAAVICLDPVGDALEAVATKGPRDLESTLAIPLTTGGVLVLTGIRDSGAATMPGVVSAVGALASAVLEQSRRATRLAEEFEALQKGHHQTIETERLHAVGELAAGAAHHLNNVMTVILGSVDLALRRPHSVEIGHLEAIRQAALEVTEIVRRLGSFSRRQSQGPRLIVDLNERVEEALALTRGRWHDEAQLHGIDIDVQLCAGRTLPVDADEVSLREVLVNLVFNAIDALPEGGHIRVQTWSTEDVVHCAVSDDGIGMSPEVRQRAPEPFFTTKGPRRRGLGLSLSYGIIQQHGGTLTIESAEGRGTTVTFTLPASSSVRVRETEGPVRVDTGQMVILLVDDDPIVRETIASLLADDGHKVVEAGSGAEAMTRLDTTESFDLLMTDLGMPKMNGWELIRSAKVKRPELPVVLITGWGEAPRGQRPSDPQPDAILAKPVTEEDLRQTIVRFHRRVASA